MQACLGREIESTCTFSLENLLIVKRTVTQGWGQRGRPDGQVEDGGVHGPARREGQGLQGRQQQGKDCIAMNQFLMYTNESLLFLFTPIQDNVNSLKKRFETSNMKDDEAYVIM